MYEFAMAEDDLWEGEMAGVKVHGIPVLLIKKDGEIRAYEDRCCHLGVKLSEGKVTESVLTCGAHGWQFDLKSGSGVNPPGVRLKNFPVRVESGKVMVEVA